MKTGSRYIRLVQHENGKEYDINALNTCCTETNEPLVAEYDLDAILSKDILVGREYNMWRYREMLPIVDDQHIVTLQEGFTPIHQLNSLRSEYDFGGLEMKDESFNPTGSFKARGLG